MVSVRRCAALLLCGLACLGLIACGSSGPTASHGCGTSCAQGGPPASQATRAATAEPSAVANPAVPGCDAFCRQAAPPAGTFDPGCPSGDSSKCLACPQGGCARVLTGAARAQNGVIKLDLECKVSRPCAGALHVYTLNYAYEKAGRLAMSNFSVPANHSASIAVALTPSGQSLARRPGGVVGQVWVYLMGSGIDQLGTPGPGYGGLHLRLLG